MNLAKILILYFLTPGLLSQIVRAGAQQSAPPTAQTSTPASTPKRTHHKKKAAAANCSTAPTTGGPSPAPATSASTSTLPPCPTPKKVVRNGGSAEPSIQLVGGAASTPNDQQRKIDELTAATTENLKKLEGRQLKPTEQDTVTQIKQFMNQSKSAAAEGDMERGNNLAMKARLLSDELVKP